MKSMMKKPKFTPSITGAIFKTTTEATILKEEEDTQMLEVATEDLPIITIKVLHQPPKAEEPIKETVVTKTKVTEVVKLKTMVETMTRTIVDIAKNQATLWKNVGNYKPKKHQ